MASGGCSPAPPGCSPRTTWEPGLGAMPPPPPAPWARDVIDARGGSQPPGSQGSRASLEPDDPLPARAPGRIAIPHGFQRKVHGACSWLEKGEGSSLHIIYDDSVECDAGTLQIYSAPSSNKIGPKLNFQRDHGLGRSAGLPPPPHDEGSCLHIVYHDASECDARDQLIYSAPTPSNVGPKLDFLQQDDGLGSSASVPAPPHDEGSTLHAVHDDSVECDAGGQQIYSAPTYSNAGPKLDFLQQEWPSSDHAQQQQPQKTPSAEAMRPGPMDGNCSVCRKKLSPDAGRWKCQQCLDHIICDDCYGIRHVIWRTRANEHTFAPVPANLEQRDLAEIASPAKNAEGPDTDDAGLDKLLRAIDLTDFPMPSLGSIAHFFGSCKLCHYAHSREGCKHGVRCGLCHYKHPKSRPRKAQVAGQQKGPEPPQTA